VEGIAVPTAGLNRALRTWPELADFVFIPQSEEEYRKLVAVLDRLIDEVGEDESQLLASLMDVVGALVEQYEDEHVPELSDDPSGEPQHGEQR
jgi:HTH-type transcriptional regulator/antitoxin HigA